MSAFSDALSSIKCKLEKFMHDSQRYFSFFSVSRKRMNFNYFWITNEVNVHVLAAFSLPFRSATIIPFQSLERNTCEKAAEPPDDEIGRIWERDMTLYCTETGSLMQQMPARRSSKDELGKWCVNCYIYFFVISCAAPLCCLRRPNAAFSLRWCLHPSHRFITNIVTYRFW